VTEIVKYKANLNQGSKFVDWVFSKRRLQFCWILYLNHF